MSNPHETSRPAITFAPNVSLEQALANEDSASLTARKFQPCSSSLRNNGSQDDDPVTEQKVEARGGRNSKAHFIPENETIVNTKLDHPTHYRSLSTPSTVDQARTPTEDAKDVILSPFGETSLANDLAFFEDQVSRSDGVAMPFGSKSRSSLRYRSSNLRNSTRHSSRRSTASGDKSPASTFLSMWAERRAEEPALQPDDEGQMVGTDYVLGKQIGYGSCSTFKEAFRTDGHGPTKRVAVKIVRKYLSGRSEDENEEIQAEFDREVSVWRYLNHPHVLTLDAVYETDYATFCFTKLAIGGTLFDLVRQHRQGLEPKLAKRYSYQLACAIRYLHEDARIVHRDIKLENCLLDPVEDENGDNSSTLVLGDFGMAEWMIADEVDGKQMGPAGSSTSVAGSLEYASPEQLLSTNRVIHPCVDIWAFGVTVFIVVVGSRPFQDPFTPRIRSNILSGTWNHNSVLGETSDALNHKDRTDALELIKGCLHMEADKRWTIRDILGCSWLREVAESANTPTDTTSLRHSDDASASSSMTTITVPEDGVEESIDAGITCPNDLRVVLDAAGHYKELDDLAQETYRICGIDQNLDVKDRYYTLSECYSKISDCSIALQNLQMEGFCRDDLVILAQSARRPGVAEAIHIPLLDMFPTHGTRINASDDDNVSSFWRLPGLSWLEETLSTHDNTSRLNFLCAMLSIGLVSFSGSHVCRFDIDITGNPVEVIPVGLGYSYNIRKLACLDSFIGGPVRVLGKNEPSDRQRALKVALTVEDLQELWGPIWLLGGSSAGEGRIIRTERGYIIPVWRHEQRRANSEIECHWTNEYPHTLMSQAYCEDLPMLRITSRILVGTHSITETGLNVNENCQTQISSIQQRMAGQLQLPGTTKAHLAVDGYEVNLGGGQYLSAGVVKKWKRMPARTHKSVLIELCQHPNTQLLPLLKLRVGLEVSACTGNAQRVTLWDALRLSQTKMGATRKVSGPKGPCEHNIGDINCIWSCWSRCNSASGIDCLADTPREEEKVPSKYDARRLIIHSILALQHTGVDYEANLQAWWPFSDCPLTSRISPTSREPHPWFQLIKESRDVSTFAVLSRRCLEFYERKCLQLHSDSHKSSPVKVQQTGLYTRVLLNGGNLGSLVEGEKVIVRNSHLTVEQVMRKEEVIIVATATKNILRISFRGLLREGRISCAQEHINHDVPTSLSIPIFIY
ncbi:hypothetical protein FE257_010773 [Aspergillus nanangensis]|uniref:Protein kinase domain-containing protein n=1 Tax=Aspergillus nanangensis TaxID=2582783 RepID=A0AAD4CVG2_ASPNN|nr:hypothetical protein FE257_010773 [Aspergillus nanangensis]